MHAKEIIKEKKAIIRTTAAKLAEVPNYVLQSLKESQPVSNLYSLQGIYTVLQQKCSQQEQSECKNGLANRESCTP